jgi:hypothetical protein
LYAEGTTTPVEKTKAEIERLVSNYGAKYFSSGWGGTEATGGPTRAIVQFTASDRIVRFSLPLPSAAECRKLSGFRKIAWGRMNDEQRIAAETRRRWRCLLIAIKSKLEAVNTGIESFEQAFFGEIVLPSGQTVYEHAHRLVAEIYATGKMEGRLLEAPAQGEYTPP